MSTPTDSELLDFLASQRPIITCKKHKWLMAGDSRGWSSGNDFNFINFAENTSFRKALSAALLSQRAKEKTL